jgi:hypothetical protein
MKILLKWMTGRRVVKLTCTHVGNAKKFLYSPHTAAEGGSEAGSSSETSKASAQPSVGIGKYARAQLKKQEAAAAAALE